MLAPAGAGLLLKPPPDVSSLQVGRIVLTASAGIAALAGGAQNWAIVRCRLWERLALIAAGVLLVYPHGAGAEPVPQESSVGGSRGHALGGAVEPRAVALDRRAHLRGRGTTKVIA